jgi:hypothetical protein
MMAGGATILVTPVTRHCRGEADGDKLLDHPMFVPDDCRQVSGILTTIQP